MNAQDIFDTVADHLLRQNMKCLDPKTLLVTWRVDHLSCAFGCLFPTDMDETVSRYATVKAAILHYPQLEKFKPYAELLVALQQVHDQSPSLWWPAKLRNVAERFGLSPTVLPMKG